MIRSRYDIEAEAIGHAVVELNQKLWVDHLVDIKVDHPDDFLVSLFEQAAGPVCTAVKRQREALRNPPMCIEELLTTFESQDLLQFVNRLQEFAELL